MTPRNLLLLSSLYKMSKQIKHTGTFKNKEVFIYVFRNLKASSCSHAWTTAGGRREGTWELCKLPISCQNGAFKVFSYNGDSLALFPGWCLWSPVWECICAFWRGHCLRDWFLLFFFCPNSQWFQSRSSSPFMDKHLALIWTLLLLFPVEELFFTWWGEEAEWIQVLLWDAAQASAIPAIPLQGALFPSLWDLSSTWAGFPGFELILSCSLPYLCAGLLHLIRLY